MFIHSTFYTEVIVIFCWFYSSGGGGAGKLVFGIIASTGLGFAGAIVYGKYDQKFKSMLEANVPYINYIYKMLSDDSSKQST